MSLGVEFDIWAELGHALDRNTKAIEKMIEKPVIKPIGGSVVIPTGFIAPVMCRLEAVPARGRIWEIVKVGIFGADPHTAIANVSVDVYAGYVAPVTTSVFAVPGGFQEVIISGAGVPSVTNLTTEVEYARSGEEVYALFYGTGLVAGQQYEVVARVKEYPERVVESPIIPRR